MLDRKRGDDQQQSVGIHLDGTSSTSTRTIVSTCEGGQCMSKPTFTANAAPSSYSYLQTILPSDYYKAMVEAAGFGFLYGFVTATPIEYFADHFKQQGFSAKQIYQACECIRALAMIGLSHQFGLLDRNTLLYLIGAPLASAALEHYGTPRLLAHATPSVAVVAAQFALDSSSWRKLLCTLAAGLLGTVAGRETAKQCVSLGSSLFQPFTRSNESQNESTKFTPHF